MKDGIFIYKSYTPKLQKDAKSFIANPCLSSCGKLEDGRRKINATLYKSSRKFSNLLY